MKTLITLSSILAAGTLAVNAATTLEFSKTSWTGAQTINITNSSAFDKTVNKTKTGWEISFDFNYKANTHVNEWGSTILSTGSNAYGNDYHGGFQIRWNNGTKDSNNDGKIYIKYGTEKDLSNRDLFTVAESVSFHADKTLSFTISYLDATKTMSVSLIEKNTSGVEQSTYNVDKVINKYHHPSSGKESDNDISEISTLTNTGGGVSANAEWSYSNLCGTVIPEPSMFGLLAGLGALAIAGTRRRRR